MQHFFLDAEQIAMAKEIRQMAPILTVFSILYWGAIIVILIIAIPQYRKTTRLLREKKHLS